MQRLLAPFDQSRTEGVESRILPGVTDMKKPVPPVDLAMAAPPNEDRKYFEFCGDHPFLHTPAAFELVNAWWLAAGLPLRNML